MVLYRKMAFISTTAVYLLIFIGGLVRVAGAGLGCPDWPKCFGHWIPPISISQLPPDIDPALFNFTLAWIEYINRLIGVFIGILILVTAVLAVKYYRNVPKIMYTTIAAALLVGFQGWYGSLVVGSELLPITVTIHMLLALLIACLLIYVTQSAFYHENPDSDKGAVYPAKTRTWTWFLAGAAVMQVVLGTQIRSALEILREQFPLLTASEWLDLTGVVQNIHWVLGVAMFFISWHIGIKVLKFSERLPLLVKQSAVGIMALVVIQLVIGIVVVTAGLPALAQLFHLWVASLYLGLIVLLSIALKRGEEKLAV
ncbi:COX15/CtaA family protein [candidate division KSB1 bacterium]|nr:COX15/CtaA family protein [candidate division KSB1 bacterium]